MNHFLDSVDDNALDLQDNLFLIGNQKNGQSGLDDGLEDEEDITHDQDEVRGALNVMTPEAIEVFNEFSFGPKENMTNWLAGLENQSTKIVNAKSNEDRSYHRPTVKRVKSRYDDSKNDYSCYIKLIANIIDCSFSDAKPFSVIMAVSNNFGASATPDLESVYDAHMFFKPHRIGTWTGLVGADPSSTIRKFKKHISDWDRRYNFGRAVVSSAIVALDGDEEYISTSTAVEFIYNDNLFNFWCHIAGICPEKVKSHYNLTPRVTKMRSEEMEVKFSKKHRIKHSTEPKLDLSPFSVVDETPKKPSPVIVPEVKVAKRKGRPPKKQFIDGNPAEQILLSKAAWFDAAKMEF